MHSCQFSMLAGMQEALLPTYPDRHDRRRPFLYKFWLLRILYTTLGGECYFRCRRLTIFVSIHLPHPIHLYVLLSTGYIYIWYPHLLLLPSTPRRRLTQIADQVTTRMPDKFGVHVRRFISRDALVPSGPTEMVRKSIFASTLSSPLSQTFYFPCKMLSWSLEPQTSH
jgi:hypothetical protein